MAAPDGGFPSHTYDDVHRLTDVTDSLAESLHYTLDAMGNRTQEEVKDPAGTLVRSQRRVYDALNRVQNLITPAQQTSTRGSLSECFQCE